MENQSIESLYHDLLGAWDLRDAKKYASLFRTDAEVIGFDGSVMSGAKEIENQLSEIFASHPTATYVAKVRQILPFGKSGAVLSAIAGMVPRGGSDINPNVNAMQTLIAEQIEGRWKIVLFQNTPAALHGRPHLAAQLTQELRQVLKSKG
jgi:uncharacterized protein (TIGR02246 family)